MTGSAIAVYLEDSERDSDRFGTWLQRAWESLAPHAPMEVRTFTEPAAALNAIAELNPVFFVTDLLFGENNEPLGIHAIRDARAKHANLPIIAITGGDASLQDMAREARVDAFISKKYILHYDVELKTMIGAISTALRKHALSPAGDAKCIVDYDKADWNIRALVGSIGEDHLAELTRAVANVQALTRIDVSYIRSGLSGAGVVNVIAHNVGKEAGRHRILLKISRDGGALRAELASRAAAKWWPVGLLVPFITDEVIEADGWYAIAADMIPDAITLEAALGTNTLKSRTVTSMLEWLFGPHGLGAVYSETRQVLSESPEKVLHGLFTVARRARLETALAALRRATERYGDAELKRGELTRRFLDAQNVETVGAMTTTTWSSHGDLHARNVVCAGSRAWLIDPASITHLHWAGDVARLAVDLIVSALDATEDFDWNRISQWLNVVRTFVGLKPLPSKGIPRALSRVRDVAFQIAPIPESDARREFYLALAVEFLRSTYRIDISLPKRVLAYEAGELCFRLARGAGRVAGRGKA